MEQAKEKAEQRIKDIKQQLVIMYMAFFDNEVTEEEINSLIKEKEELEKFLTYYAFMIASQERKQKITDRMVTDERKIRSKRNQLEGLQNRLINDPQNQSLRNDLYLYAASIKRDYGITIDHESFLKQLDSKSNIA